MRNTTGSASVREEALQAAPNELYIKAKQCNPVRWSGNRRDWSPIGPVILNPERDEVVNMAACDQHTQQKAVLHRRQLHL